ncbi:hypothetical protein PISMIDRAFT_688466, partial [Pisolithus microcarpus 441]
MKIHTKEDEERKKEKPVENSNVHECAANKNKNESLSRESKCMHDPKARSDERKSPCTM